MPIFLIFWIGSIVWVGVDAGNIKRESQSQRGPANTSPAAWVVACTLLWIVFFPVYLIRRGDKVVAQASSEAIQSAPTHIKATPFATTRTQIAEVTLPRSADSPIERPPDPEPEPEADRPRKAKFCSECGTPIAGGAKFCAECGTPVVAGID